MAVVAVAMQLSGSARIVTRTARDGVAMSSQARPSGSGATLTAATTGRRPNIVVVMTDDMRVDELAYMPRVRRLVAATGVRFANSFSPDPLCCPARASFLTGRYSHNHHVTSNGDEGIWGGFGRFDDSHTFPRALKASGYRTGFIGKYLNGYGAVRSRVTGGPSLHYVPAGWTDWYGAVQPPRGSGFHGGTYHYFNTPFNVNGRIDHSHAGQYQTGVIGKFARRLVTKYHQSRHPFFLWASFVAPHFGKPREPGDYRFLTTSNGKRDDMRTPARPRWVRGRFNSRIVRAAGMPVDGGPAEADMSDKPSFMRVWPEATAVERRAMRASTRQRAEAVYVVDRQVGRLIHTLQADGEWRNTVLVFTSDNGYFLGEHRLRAGKIKAHEPSLRVPLLLTGPGIPKGQMRYDPITTVDLAPTILQLAHARRYYHRGCDRASKLPMIIGGDRGWYAPVVTEGRVPSSRLYAASAPGFRGGLTSIGLRTARYSYIRYVDGEQELYDLRDDPNEFQSVATDPAYLHVLTQLRTLWGTYHECAGQACQAALPLALRASPTEERRLTQDYWAAVHAEYGTHRGDRI